MERKHVQEVELALRSTDQCNQSFHGSTWTGHSGTEMTRWPYWILGNLGDRFISCFFFLSFWRNKAIFHLSNGYQMGLCKNWRWIIWITIMGALVEGWVHSDLDCHCEFLSAIRNDEFYCSWVVSEIDKYDSLYQSSLVSEFGNNTLLLSSLY